jgi:hypothetical protein
MKVCEDEGSIFLRNIGTYLLDYMFHILEDYNLKMSYGIIYLVSIDGIIGLIVVPWCSLLSSWFFIQHMLVVKFDPLKRPQV